MKRSYLLSKAEMKHVKGGDGPEPIDYGPLSGPNDNPDGVGVCRVFVRDPATGSGYWTDKNYSVEKAQSMFGGGTDPVFYTNGFYISGYCCASC